MRKPKVLSRSLPETAIHPFLSLKGFSAEQMSPHISPVDPLWAPHHLRWYQQVPHFIPRQVTWLHPKLELGQKLASSRSTSFSCIALSCTACGRVYLLRRTCSWEETQDKASTHSVCSRPKNDGGDFSCLPGTWLGDERHCKLQVVPAHTAPRWAWVDLRLGN